MRWIVLAALFFAVPASAALKVGDVAPGFETDAALKGKPFAYSLSRSRAKGPVVLYFFPAAFTPGCSLEAREFAEAMADFRKLGASVVGASGDDIAKLAKFSREECRDKFPVAVATPAIIKAFDVGNPLSGRTNRTSYIVAPDGTIAYVYSNGDYRGHVSGALAALRAWKAKGRRVK